MRLVPLVEEGLGVPFALVGLVQHPAGAEGVPFRILICVGLARLRVGVDLSDHIAAILQGNSKIVLRLPKALFTFSLASSKECSFILAKQPTAGSFRYS